MLSPRRILIGGILTALAWSAVALFLYHRVVAAEYESIKKQALSEARAAYEKDLVYRRWAARLGGVYVRVSKELQPNEYLKVPNRDVTTTEDIELTLVNPAYMTRMVHALMTEASGLKGHITSLNPIRPENAPADWEKLALQTFHEGQREMISFDDENGQPVLHYMQAMITEKICLKCHAEQGYKEGDIRGGISVTVPMNGYEATLSEFEADSRLTFFLLWLVGAGLIGAYYALKYRHESIRSENESILMEYRGVVEHSNELFAVLDKRHIYKIVNQTLLDQRGLARDEVEGRHARDVLGERHYKSLTPYLDKCFSGEDVRFEVDMEYPNKEERRLEVEYYPITGADGNVERTAAVIRDITERTLAEAKFKREYNINQALAEIAEALTLPGVTVIDVSEVVHKHAMSITKSRFGFVSSIDPETGNNIGHTLSSMMEEDICQVQDQRISFPRSADGYPGLWGSALNERRGFYTNAPSEHPNSTGLPEGHVPLKSFLTAPAVFEGELLGQVAVANAEKEYVDEDLEAVKALSNLFASVVNRMRSQDELMRARDKAVAASKVKSEFLANMSHELRTPLNGVMGMLQLLGGTPLDPEQTECMELALQSCQRLTNLMGDILDMTRIEAGKMQIHPEPFNLMDCLDAVEQVFRPSVSQGNVELRFEIDSQAPQILRGDAPRLQQVLNNLVGNALKFTTAGSVGLKVTLLPSESQNQSRMLFSVTDTGIGIPAERIEGLFEPFIQADGSYRRGFQGAGLGLSIVRRLVELMGGKICVSSEENKGSCFDVYLPFEIVDTPATRPERLVRRMQQAEKTYKALLAEDDRVNQLAAARCLQKLGFEVLSTENGAQALEALQQQAFDVVIMDVQMPVMDGVEATQRIRNAEAGEANKNIPIIAMTAFAMAGDRKRFLDAGMDAYLSKPVAMTDLVRVLNEILHETLGAKKA